MRHGDIVCPKPPATVTRPSLIASVLGAILGTDGKAATRRPRLFSPGRPKAKYYGGGGSKKYDVRDVAHRRSRDPVTRKRIVAYREWAEAQAVGREIAGVVDAVWKERRPKVKRRLVRRLEAIAKEHGPEADRAIRDRIQFNSPRPSFAAV
jgi:hypothetical protein